MPKHTEHREQCKSCKCPKDSHNYLPIDTYTAQLCGCPCHQYCDCEVCLPVAQDQPYGEVYDKQVTEDLTPCPACDYNYGHEADCQCSCHGPQIVHADDCKCTNCLYWEVRALVEEVFLDQTYGQPYLGR